MTGAASAAKRASSRSSASALRPPASARASSISSRVEDRRPAHGAAPSNSRSSSRARALGERARPARCGLREPVDRRPARTALLLPARPRLLDACAARAGARRARAQSASSGRSSRPGARSQASRSAGVPGAGPVRRRHAAQQPDQRAPDARCRRSGRLTGIAIGNRRRPPKTSPTSAAAAPGRRTTTAISSAGMPSAQQRGNPPRDQLELGALAAALQQLDRAGGVDAGRAGLEQVTLEVRERARVPPASSGRLARRQAAVLVAPAERASGTSRPAPRRRRARPRRRARRSPRRLDHTAERLDRVELQRRQVVEAVEQHRRRRPTARDARAARRARRSARCCSSRRPIRSRRRW